MSDNEASGSAPATDAKHGMPQGDVEFLIACLKNTTGGTVSIDSKAVAEALGYYNHRSVQNRVSALKKKYDLPFGSTSASKGDGSTPSSATKSKKASHAAGPNEPAISTTPSKNKIVKKRAPAAKKSPKTPTPRKKLPAKKPGKKDEEDEDADAEGETDEEMTQAHALKTPTQQFEDELITDDERIFGKKEKFAHES